MKRVGKFLLIFVILMVILVGLLVLASSFPSASIKNNVASSSKTLNEEGNRKICFIFNKLHNMEFDNYSDSLMINTAYSIDNQEPLYAAFTAKKDYIPGVTKTIFQDNVGELKSSSRYERHNEVAELEDTVNGIGEESFEYAKYWHGYLIILRPLLLVLDYQQIRVIITFVFALLAIFTTTALAEKKNNVIATFYLLSLVFVEYFYIGLSLINSFTFLIAMIASCLIVYQFEKIKDWEVVFFIIGVFGGFLTLLDTPLLMLGAPLVLYFAFKEGTLKENMRDFIKLVVFWFLGYFLTWMTKWILMDLIYHRELLKISFGQIFYRSFGRSISPIGAICFNLLYMAVPIMITVWIMMYMLIAFHKNITKETRRKGRIYIVIGVLPFLWYTIFANHSLYHFFFTYRLQFISMLSALLWTYYVCGEPGRRKEK